jgi:hypothetical protein
MQPSGDNYVMSSFIVFTSHCISLVEQVKVYKKGGECSTHGDVRIRSEF